MGTVKHNSLTPNSRNCEALESYEHESPETQQYTMIIVCRKTWNAYETSLRWSSKDEVKIQIMAYQPSNHHKVVITVLIHTWNEHLNTQVKQEQSKILVCPTLNQCIIH